MANVIAEASTTIEWLRATPSIAIPVYQREYRWRQASCEQLLTDVRAIAGAPKGRTHFIGSILATPEQSGGVTLVDGQQRVTTIMLMLAAIRAHAAGRDAAITRAVEGLTLQPAPQRSPRLQTHARYRGLVSEIMMGGQSLITGSSESIRATVFEENFLYFYDCLAEDWESAWEGLQRLEQVTIGLLPNASAQQIFESLNSTGAVLSDDELIHNYIHMGRSHEDQLQLERDTWIPIEQAAHGEIRAFWRDYLVLISTTQPDFSGDFGIYRAFRRRFPPFTDITERIQAEWVRQAERYGVLLRPADEPEQNVREQLDLLRAFEGAPRSLLLGLYGDYVEHRIDKLLFINILEQVQSLFIRRALVGLPRDIGLAGAVCREFRVDPRQLPGALLRRTPEDPAVRLALTHSSLPLAGYVLRRLQRPGKVSGLQVEHIYPQTPLSDWTGGGAQWGELSNEEQAHYRTLLNTIGNLTLIEAELNAGASNRSFREKSGYYARSEIKETRELAERRTWDASAIEERTQSLVQRFLTIWPRPSDVPMDEPQELTRVVDLAVPHNSNADPDRFEYAVFKGDLWGDVHDIRTLHWRLVQALDRLDGHRLRAAEFGGHITATTTAHTRYAGPLEDGSYVYQGWWPCYLLQVVQAWITAFELDDEVAVKLLELANSPDVPAPS